MTEPPQRDLSNAAAVSSRWVSWRERIDVKDYDRRFDALSAAGAYVHGEADFIASYKPANILDAGCGTGRIAIELDRRGFDVTGVDLDADMIDAADRKAPHMRWMVDDLARMQLTRRFDLIAMPGNVMIFCEPADRRLIVHNMAQHLEPGGILVAGFTLERGGYTLQAWDDDCRANDLTLVERYSTWDRAPFTEHADYHVSVHRRTERFTVHDLVAEARHGLRRVSPQQLHDAMTTEALGPIRPVVILDTRQSADRQEQGFIEGSLPISRNVLEWRVDPGSGYASPAITGFEQQIVVVCNDGYSSSLAAANLQRLGFVNATDLVGGFRAWLRAGLPVVHE